MKAELSFLFLLGFLGKKYSLDIGKNTTLRDSHTGEQFVQLFVISDGQLKVTGNDSCLLNCCHEQRFQPTQGSQRSNTQAQQPGTLEHQHQHAQHSCLSEEDGGYDQQGTEALLEMIDSWTWCP